MPQGLLRLTRHHLRGLSNPAIRGMVTFPWQTLPGRSLYDVITLFTKLSLRSRMKIWCALTRLRTSASAQDGPGACIRERFFWPVWSAAIWRWACRPLAALKGKPQIRSCRLEASGAFCVRSGDQSTKRRPGLWNASPPRGNHNTNNRRFGQFCPITKE
jgi:hypothetical protein